MKEIITSMCPFEPMKPEQDEIGILEVIQDKLLSMVNDTSFNLLLTYRQIRHTECIIIVEYHTV